MRDLAAQTAHGLPHLDAERPAAEDQQAARDGLHTRRLAIGPDAVDLAQPRDRRDERVRAARHHNMFGGVAHAIDLHDARPAEPAAATPQIDTVLRQPALLPGVGVIGDHEVPPGQRRLDVDVGTRRRVARVVHSLARPQQRLGRDARPVGAFAADQLRLDESDA